MKNSLIVIFAALAVLLAACSASTPPAVDKRVDAQRQGAQKAQQELSR